jgi:hypothetical protein
MLIFLALLAVSTTAPTVRENLPSEVSESLKQALVVPGARMSVISYSGLGTCNVRQASVPHPVEGSGKVAVKYSGKGCAGWIWVRLEVWADTTVTTRLVRAGEPIASGSALVEREMRPGQLPFIPPSGAVASHSMPAGTMVGPGDVATAAIAMGEPLAVVFVSGAVAIETRGRRSPCLRDRTCATLATGKHVEGQLDASGRLIVEVSP